MQEREFSCEIGRSLYVLQRGEMLRIWLSYLHYADDISQEFV